MSNGRFKVNGRSSWKVVVASSGGCRAIAGGGHACVRVKKGSKSRKMLRDCGEPIGKTKA